MCEQRRQVAIRSVPRRLRELAARVRQERVTTIHALYDSTSFGIGMEKDFVEMTIARRKAWRPRELAVELETAAKMCESCNRAAEQVLPMHLLERLAKFIAP